MRRRKEEKGERREVIKRREKHRKRERERQKEREREAERERAKMKVQVNEYHYSQKEYSGSLWCEQ